jgi:hypothetical protein
MPPYPRTLAFTSGIAIAVVAMSSAFSADRSSQQITDAQQEAQVWRAYAQSHYLRANNLEVAVLDGKVTLTGQVAGQLNKDLARLIALGIAGVVEVDNRIVVHTEAPLPKPPDRSGTPAYFAEQARRGSWSGNLDESAFSPAHETVDPAPPGNRVNSGWLSGGADNPGQRTPILGRAQTRDEANSVNREGFKF